MAVILEVKHLVKNYKNTQAVNDVSFSIEQGICFGLLGPNGAGKTTVLEVVEGVISPVSGEILYKGKPRSSLFKEEIGIQFQQTALLSFLTVRETLETFQNLYKKTHDLEYLIDMCHLKSIENQFNDKISGGQQQRLLFALALINNPELLFLDEPSAGLDPQSRQDVWNIVQQVKQMGNTIILTTHYMEEAQYLCDEIAIMDYGKIIARGSPEDLIKEHGEGMTVVLPKENFKFPLPQLPMNYKTVKDKIEIKTKDIDACLNVLRSKNVGLSDMVIRSPNLEDVFLNLTGRQLRT
jgi:ABC-2 type transport system ATP-binding protein